jgi:hypothetical protein
MREFATNPQQSLSSLAGGLMSASLHNLLCRHIRRQAAHFLAKLKNKAKK